MSTAAQYLVFLCPESHFIVLCLHYLLKYVVMSGLYHTRYHLRFIHSLRNCRLTGCLLYSVSSHLGIGDTLVNIGIKCN